MNDIKRISGELIRKIGSLSQKKFRQKYAIFPVEGDKLIESLLHFPDWEVLACVVDDSRVVQTMTNPLIERAETSIYWADDKEWMRISSLHTPPGILCLVKQRIWPFQSPNSGGRYFCLDGIRDPGNLGTIIRVADWFGMDGVFCTPDCVDLYNPKTVQSTMGSIFKVPVWYMDRESIWDLAGHMQWIAADMNGVSHKSFDWETPQVILIGSESHGVGEFFNERVTCRVSIAGHPDKHAESLNASIAAAILAAESYSQR